MLHTTQINDIIGEADHRFFSLVYEELHRMASRHLHGEKPSFSLQPTDLVNEVWLKLFRDSSNLNFESRGHFFVVVSTAIRQILVDAARSRKSLKRGGKFRRNELSELELNSIRLPDDDELLDLDEALSVFEMVAPEKAKLVKLRFFSGLTLEESAQILGISVVTASRYWKFSKAWLRTRISRR